MLEAHLRYLMKMTMRMMVRMARIAPQTGTTKRMGLKLPLLTGLAVGGLALNFSEKRDTT